MALVLLLLAVMWIGAGIYYFRGRPESRSADSIGSFRRQLRVLERTSPSVIDPAHRMRDAVPGLLLGPVHAPGLRRQMARTPSMVALQRRRTVKRRRDIFFGLLLGIVGSLLLGVIPGLHVMWLLSGFLVVVLAAYVGLLVSLRGQATERAAKVRLFPAPAQAAEPAFLLRRPAN